MVRGSFIRFSLSLFAAMLMIGVLFAIAPGSVMAEQGGDYTYTVTDDKAMITGYTGAGGAIIIPSTLGGYPVDAIANGAFNSAAGHLVTEATLPSSLTSFGLGVFEGCSILTAIHVDAVSVNFKSINGALYNYNGTTLLECPPGISGNFTVPDGTITVAYRAFVSCSKLISITIPDSVTTIGQDAFVLCRSLSVVNLGAGVNSIGPGWLAYCTAITALNVAEENTNYSSIDGILYNEGQTTLIQHPYLKSNNFTIPSTVTTIANGALTYCTKLYTVYIPESVSSIGEEVFLGSTSLTSITVDPNNLHYTSLDGVLYTKDMSVLVACPGAMPGDFTVPDGVTHIEINAFQKCIYLTSINVSDSVQTVGGGAFMGCSISSISFGTSFSSIGAYAFYYAESLTAMYFRSMTAPTFVGDWWVAFTNEELLGHAYAGSDFPAPGEYFYDVLMGERLVNESDFLYTVADGNATITGYIGQGGDVDIPSTLGGYPVVAIGDSAFVSASGRLITSVMVSDTVISIGSSAFYNNPVLTSLTIGSNVRHIGAAAFKSCTALTSVAIPDSVETIGTLAFEWDSSITNVTMGKGVLSIGGAAFNGMTSLTAIHVDPENTAYCSVDGVVYSEDMTVLVAYPANKPGDCIIPYGVTTIGTAALGSNRHIGSLSIPESVTLIEDYAIWGTLFTSITFPDSLEIIPGYTCQYSPNLASIVIGKNVETIGLRAFAACGSLSSITFRGTVAPTIVGPDWIGLGTPSEVRGHASSDSNFPAPGEYFNGLLMGEYDPQVFTYTVSEGNATITGYTGDGGDIRIPEIIDGYRVVAIGTNAFRSNHDITSVLIPESVIYLGDSSFQGCINLTSANIPENVTYIGSYAFQSSGLNGPLVISDNVTYIGSYAFYACDLSSLVLGSNLVTIGSNAFEHNVHMNGDLVIPDGIVDIHPNTFHRCNLTSVVLGPNLKSIGHNAFEDNLYLTGDLEIPDGVTYIGPSAFRNCDFASLVMGPNVGTIGNNAFENNRRMVGDLVIPDSVTEIYPNTFNGCNLTSLFIGPNVHTIGWGAFSNNHYLTGELVIPDSVTYIGPMAFQSCNFTSLTIGENLTMIEANLFEHNSYITGSVEIPDSVTIIGPNAFHGCSQITSFVIGTGLQTIGHNAFDGCVSLTSISFNGMIAPTTVDINWIYNTNHAILGHAYAASNFPAPGEYFNGLLMGAVIPVAPEAPTGLQAVPGNGNVTLSWFTPADGGAPIDHYLVYQDGVLVDTCTTNISILTGLVNGQSYSFNVSAVNVAGEGPTSGSVSTMPRTTPDAPSWLMVVVGNGSASLNWTAPSWNGGADIDHYIVYQDGVDIRHIAGLSTVITGLVNGQSYEFYVSAHNAAGAGVGSSVVTAVPYTIPNAPTGLVAEPGNGVIALNWTAPNFNGGRAIDYYIIYQDGVDIRHIAGLSTVITGLVNGQSYEFSVSAHNLAGEGLSSSTSSAIPYTYSNAPTGLNGAAGFANVTLNWTVPAFDGGRPIDYYVVYQNGTIITQVIETSVTITGLVNGVEYQFTVSAHNLAGTGPISSAVYAIPYSSPDAPTGLTALDGFEQVVLNWTAPAFDGGRAIIHYVIYQDGLDVLHVNTTSATISGLQNGRAYEFTVCAINLAGIGQSSSSVQSIPFTVPNPVTGLTAMPGNGNVTLNWTAPSFDGGRDIDNYNVFVDGTLVGQVAGTSMTIEGLQNGREYFAYVIAHNLAGSMGPDEFVNFIPYAAPDAPTGLTAIDGNGNVTLNWAASAFNGGRAIDYYVVYQDGMDVGHVAGTTLLIEGLLNGQTYDFFVTAHNLAGEGAPSESASAVPFTVSEAPTGLTAVPSDANVTLNWTAPVFDGGRPIDYYVVYLDGVDVEHVSTTFVWFEGLKNGQTYEFSVSAHNLAGEGASTAVITSVPYTVPGVPSDPTAEAQNAFVILRWAAPSFDGGRYIDYYIIYQDGVDIRHVNGTMSMIHGLQNGQTYEFSVSAHNLAGEGTMSTAVQSIPFTVPDAPTGLTSVDGDGNTFLNWTAPAFDGGRSIDHYTVYINGINLVNVGTTWLSVDGLANGLNYSFTVTAWNLAGESPQSASAFSMPYTAPDVPTGLTAIGGNGNVTLNWTAPGFNGGRVIDHYVVYQDGMDVAHANGTWVIIEGLLNGQTYEFSVSAHNLAGEGVICSGVTAVPFTTPDAPFGLITVEGNSAISLSWTTPAFDGGRAIDHYIVYLDGVDIGHPTDPSLLIEGLTNGVLYELSVSAYNLAGEGVSSLFVYASPYTIPDAPTGLMALPGDGNVTLNWTAPSFNGGRIISYYTIYEDGVEIGTFTVTSAYIEGLINGQEYTYTVSAYNLRGESGLSEPVMSTPYTAPNSPSGLSATAGNSSVGLNWTAPAFDGGRPIDYYVVYQDGVDVRHVTDSYVFIGGLVNGQEYTFTVSAHNQAGNSAVSIAATAIPYTIPDAPTGLTALAGDTNVTLNWTAPSFDGGRSIDFFFIYQDGVFVRQVSGTTALIEGLSNGQTYEFYVIAHNVAGDGAQPLSVMGAPYTTPDAPTGLTAIAGDGNVTLNWTGPSFNGGRTIDYYIVFQDGVDIQHIAALGTVITGLLNGQTYEFFVSAHNMAGSGTFSASASSVPFGLPDAPTGLTAVAGDGNITLSWSVPAFDGGRPIDYYIVFQDGVGIGQVDLTSLFVEGLVNGQEYEFTVSANNLAGQGPISVAVVAVPYAVPDRPIGLVAIAGVQNVTLNWTAPNFNGGRAIDYYIVYQDGVDVKHVTGTSVVVSGLLRDRSYEFSVAAHNLAGTGLKSNSILSTPYGVADPPIDLTAQAGDANATLSWNAPSFNGGRAIDYYVVYQDGVDIGHVLTTYLLVEGLLNGQIYEFSVAAHNLAGTGAASSNVIAIPFTLPGAPTGLSALEGNANVVLSWSSPAFDGGRGVDHYVVYQDGVDVAHVTSTTAAISGLANGDSYTFSVSAVNLAGEGQVSNEVAAVPFTVPGVPTGLSIFPGDAQVTMLWTAPANDGGRPIDHYVVLRDGVDVMHVTGTSAVVIGLTNGVGYTFSVQAHNMAGTGEKTMGLISIPFTVPDAPTDLTASYGDSQVTLTWLAPASNGGRPIDHYVVYQDGVDVKHVIGLAAIMTGLTNGVQYSFAISAHNPAGYGANSSTVTAIPITGPGVPSGLTAVPGNANVTLSWMAPNEDGGSVIDYYVVYQDDVDVLHVTGTSVVITGLSNGVDYGFSVAAHNSAGVGDPTAPVIAVPYTVPNAPTGLKAIAKDGAAALNWTAPSFDGGRVIDHYIIYQDGVEVDEVTGLNVTITGLINGLNYTFRVAAVNAAGIGTPSVAITVKPYQYPPSAPLNVQAVLGDHAVVVSWDQPTNSGGSEMTGYELYRQERGMSAELVAELGLSSLNYTDLAVTPGVEYRYYVVAVNSLGESDPSEQSEPVIAWASIVMDQFSEVLSGPQGLYVTTSGSIRMAYGNVPLTGLSVHISYRMSGEDGWTFLQSVMSSTAGSFIMSWFPPSYGTLAVKAEWVGNERYPAESVTANLAIAPPTPNGDVLSVETNSVVTDLSYNSKGNFLHFKVSGENGTEGYMKVTISKDLVSDVTKLRIKIDSDFVEFTLNETEDSYVLYLTYHHSTHEVFAYLDYSDGAEKDDPFTNLLIVLVLVMGVMGIIAVALLRRKDQP